MSSFTRLIAGLLLLAFILTSVLAMFAFTAEQVLFHPEPYLRAFRAQNFYQRFPALLAELAAQRSSFPEPDATPEEENQLRYLNQSDYEMIFASLFTPAWLEDQARTVLDQLFAYLNFQEPELHLIVSMQEVKTRLSGEQGKEISLRVVRSWPPCTAEQLLAITAQGLFGELEGFPTCKPPDELLNLTGPLLEFSITQFANTIPDQVDLADAIPGTASTSGKQLNQALLYRAFRWSQRLSPIAALICLLMVTVIAVRSWRSWLGWWGVGLAAAGGLGLGLGLLAGLPFLTGILRALFNQSPAQIGDNFTQAVLSIGQYVAQQYILWIGIESAVLFMLGIGMLAVWYLTRRT